MEEWEEPLHPGSLEDVYPTFLHKATLLAHFPPQASTARLRNAPNAPSRRGVARWEAVGPSGLPVAQDRVRATRLHAVFQSTPAFRPMDAL